MNPKRFKYHFIYFLTILLIINSFLIIETSALTYSNPSTTPIWTYSTGEERIPNVVDISSDGNYIAFATQYDDTYTYQNYYGELYLFNNSISTTTNLIWNYSIALGFNSIAMSENGSYLIVGGNHNHEVSYLFNNSYPSPEWAYYTGGDFVRDVEITEDGHYAVSASYDTDYALLYNITNNLYVKKYYISGSPSQVEVSSDGCYMAVIGSDYEISNSTLYFFNTSKNLPEWTFNLEGHHSVYLSMSADGEYIAVGSDHGRAYLFNKNGSNPIWTYNTPTSIDCIKISKNGNYIVASGYIYNNGGSPITKDYKIFFFERSNPTPKWIYSDYDVFNTVAISSDGKWIAAQSYNQFVYLFNKSSSDPIWRYKLDGYPQTHSIGMSSDGKYIVVGGYHNVYLFDRDIINPSKLVFSGYNLFLLILTIAILLIISLMIFFLYRSHKKMEKEVSN